MLKAVVLKCLEIKAPLYSDFLQRSRIYRWTSKNWKYHTKVHLFQ